MTANNLKGKITKRIILILLIILIVVMSILYMSIGIKKISLFNIINILLSKLPFIKNIINTDKINPTLIIIITQIRLPRILLGILVGAGFSISGASLQGVFRNPLVDPYIIGISSGATFGAVIAIITGLNETFFGIGAVTFCAFIGGLNTSLIIFLIVNLQKRRSNTKILLIGIAINLFLSSIVSFLIILNQNKLENIIFWIMGSLSNSNWNKVMVISPFFLIGFFGLFFFSNSLNAMSVGEDIAVTSGINLKRDTYLILIFSALITSACVAAAGIIGFVGLIVPHIARLIFGNNYKIIFPFSAVIGALILTFSDFLARIMLSPTELPLGIITSIFGVPFFVFLIYRFNKQVY